MMVTRIIWEEKAKEDYDFWLKNDTSKVEKIKNIILSCKENPFKGIGKPEPLKGNLSGYWSRRIDKEHRFVYLFTDGTLTIAQCRYHY